MPAGKPNRSPSLLVTSIFPRALLDGLPGMAYRGRADRARTIEFASAGRQALLGLPPHPQIFHSPR